LIAFDRHETGDAGPIVTSKSEMIDPSHTDRSIGIVVSCRVQPGQAASFEEGLRRCTVVTVKRPEHRKT
jgi:hypothetical protein